MHPRVGSHGTGQEGRGSGAGDQACPPRRHALARAFSMALPLVLTLSACSGDVPKDIDPRYWWRNVSGAYLDERQPPPGLDQPYPNLATVPARPVPPDAATRAAISASLAEDRAASSGFATRSVAVPGLPGAPAETAGPPAPPRLSAAPLIRFDQRGEPLPSGTPAQGRGAPARPAQAAPPQPAGPPPAPLPELLGLPPPPTQDLLAPRGN